MKLKEWMSLALMLFAIGVFTSGCADTAPTDGDAHGDHDHDGHDHDEHDDDHASHDHPAHGPNGGHIFKFDDQEVQGEWCKYKDNDMIRMHLLGADGKTPMAVKVDSFIVRPSVGNDDTMFELDAENADADGKASTFMLDDKSLTIAIPLGVKIEVKAGDKTMMGEIKAHAPLDH